MTSWIADVLELVFVLLWVLLAGRIAKEPMPVSTKALLALGSMLPVLLVYFVCVFFRFLVDAFRYGA